MLKTILAAAVLSIALTAPKPATPTTSILMPAPHCPTCVTTAILMPAPHCPTCVAN